MEGVTKWGRGGKWWEDATERGEGRGAKERVEVKGEGLESLLTQWS